MRTHATTPTSQKCRRAAALGGAGDDAGTGIAVDPAGNVYITGTTKGGFPTTPGAFQPSPPVQPSIPAAYFVAKLNPQGTKFEYVTCLQSSSAGAQGPGSGPAAIAVDAQGNAYITGSTVSSQTFIAKASPDGSTLLYNTLLGDASSGLAITVDGNGDAYVTGQTTAIDFPVTPGAFQTSLKSCQTTELTYCLGNAFVAELNPSGKVAFATSLGGSRTDTPFAIQVDSAGYVYVAGETSSPHFPTTPGSYEPNALIPMWSLPTADSYGSPGGFAAKLSPAGDKLAYSTYVFSDGGVRTMTLDNAGGAYVTGVTGGGVGVTASAPQPCMVANEDAFVTHLDLNGALLDIHQRGRQHGQADFRAANLRRDTRQRAHFQVPVDVLQRDYRVIDHARESQRHAAQDHGISKCFPSRPAPRTPPRRREE